MKIAVYLSSDAHMLLINRSSCNYIIIVCVIAFKLKNVVGLFKAKMTEKRQNIPEWPVNDLKWSNNLNLLFFGC